MTIIGQLCIIAVISQPFRSHFELNFASISYSILHPFRTHFATISQSFLTHFTSIISQSFSSHFATISQPFRTQFCIHFVLISPPFADISHSFRNHFTVISNSFHIHYLAVISQPFCKHLEKKLNRTRFALCICRCLTHLLWRFYQLVSDPHPRIISLNNFITIA